MPGICHWNFGLERVICYWNSRNINVCWSYVISVWATSVLWIARWSHFPPDFYIIFVLFRNLVGWTKLGNLSNFSTSIDKHETTNRKQRKTKMKGVEKTKVHMHDRMILVVYTNQNSQLSQPTSMVKTTYYARLFQQFSFAENFDC